MKDEMSGVNSMHGKDEKFTGFWSKNWEERNMKGLQYRMETTLKWVLQKESAGK